MMVRLMCYDETSNDIPPVGEKTTKPWVRDAAFLFCFVLFFYVCALKKKGSLGVSFNV